MLYQGVCLRIRINLSSYIIVVNSYNFFISQFSKFSVEGSLLLFSEAGGILIF
jgi:hypothetical protein